MSTGVTAPLRLKLFVELCPGVSGFLLSRCHKKWAERAPSTNIYAEINLETKARALATCEVEGGAERQKQWRDQPDLLTFLRTL